MDKARVVIWEGGDTFDLESIELPELSEGETLVRLRTATICGSDRHTVSGRRAQPCPSILGHEGVGEVIATQNPDIEVGQRVTFSVTAPCMNCDRCRAGRTAKCRRVLKTGHESLHSEWPLSGTYSTHILLRKNQPVVVVPDAIDNLPASIASCAGGTVMAAVEAADDLRDQRVLVMGIGMLGLIAVDVAVRAGAKVTAVDPNAKRRQWAEELGATVIDSAQFHPGPNSFDVSLELSGVGPGVDACIKCLDIGGTAVLVGSVADSPIHQLDPEWVVRGWRTITGVHNYEPRHLDQALDILQNSRITWQDVCADPIQLNRVPRAFDTAPSDYLRTPVELPQ